MVSNLDDFFQFYQERSLYDEKHQQYNLHFYEFIHPEKPCRLYLDLEYQRNENPHFDVENNLQNLLQLIGEVLKEFLNVEVSEKNFLILDSSNYDKFSNHIIIHTDELFPSNLALKDLVDNIVERMKNEKIGIVKNKEGQDELFLDASVYNKNRNFRFYKSCKFGKISKLELAENCKFYGKL